MLSLLFNLKKPYVFDDLVLFTWDVFGSGKTAPLPKVMDLRLLSKIRQSGQCRQALIPAKYFKPSRTTVAIHIRRGDVSKTNKHYSKLAYFLDIINKIQHIDKNADIHIFSTTVFINATCLHDPSCVMALKNHQKHRRQLSKSSETSSHEMVSMFEKDPNIQVHLDGDFLTDWVHFIKADIFVMSKSAFSNVPAFLNQNCVVWQLSQWTPLRLSHWLINDEKKSTQLYLPQKCFANTNGADQWEGSYLSF
mmetsp:Transcript_12254/g.15758  ORF Transcript_12254/g.15758 Transcript_12254/m.15758 type:complete len:250 (+) Transcript_12254:530-1279(+)